MKTYRINKNAERLAQGTGFAPELIYNISLVRFQGRNGRCIAAWTPGMKRPRYVYKAHTPEEYDKAMERIRQEAERFRRHDEAVARSSEEFRRSLRVGDILYSSWGWEQTNIDFYQVIAIRGSAVDLRQLDQRTTEDGYMCGTTVPLPDVFKGKTHTHRLSKKLYPHRLIPYCVEMGRAAPAVQLVRIKVQDTMENIEKIVSHYRRHQAECAKRRAEIDGKIAKLQEERKLLNELRWTEGLSVRSWRRSPA